MIPFWVKLLAIGILLAAFVTACNHRDNGLIERGAAAQRVIAQAAVDKLKADAVLKLEKALKEKGEAEEALRKVKDKQEVTDAKNIRKNAELTRQLNAIAVAGRLLDPFATSSGCGGSGSSSPTPASAASVAGSSNAPTPSGLLSAELTGFLQQQTEKADAINLAYISCRETLLAQ